MHLESCDPRLPASEVVRDKNFLKSTLQNPESCGLTISIGRRGGELPITNPKMDIGKPISAIYLSWKGANRGKHYDFNHRISIFFQQLKRAGTAKTNCKSSQPDFQQPCVCATGHRNTGWPLLWLLTTRAVSLQPAANPTPHRH